jgi:Zn-dependent protease
MDMALVLGIFELVVLALAISLHDMAQTWTASRLGDPTARMLGRLSLNPAKHFDLFGMVVWPLISLFILSSSLVLGWGKPIPVTSRNFRRPVRDEVIVYLSGPAAQMLGAGICLVLLLIIKHTMPAAASSLLIAAHLAQHDLSVSTLDLPQIFPIVLFLYFGILVNLLLLVFNLVPLPMLDGGKILRNFLPYNAQQTFDRIGLYLMIAFFVLGGGIIMLFFAPLHRLFDSLLFAL